MKAISYLFTAIGSLIKFTLSLLVSCAAAIVTFMVSARLVGTITGIDLIGLVVGLVVGVVTIVAVFKLCRKGSKS